MSWQRAWAEAELPDDLTALSDRVMDAALRVHRSIGPGFPERIYRRCLVHALRRDGIPCREESWLSVEFEGLVLENAMRTDVIVDERVLVELKAVETLHPVHGSQVISYLKASDLPLGLLLNFNVRLLRDGFRRYVHPRLLRAPPSA